MKEKPNILWLCTDQQRFDTLGCYGNRYVNTPNIDSLAEDGALFENAFSQSPVCSPSRGSFLSGRYPITCRMRQNGADIPDSELLVTKIFHDAGYYCGLAGKLHLRACNPVSGCTDMESRISDGYDEFHWSHDTSKSWGLHNEYYKWLADVHGTTYHTINTSESEYVQYGMPIEQHQSYWCAQKAIDFINERKRSQQPWLFSVNFYDPHHPFDPPRELLDRYTAMLDDIPLPAYFDGEERTKTIWQIQDHGGAYNHTSGYPFDKMNDIDHRMVRAAYWAMCDMLDIQVGRIIEALRENDELEDTIILFHSDHGEMLGDHGIYLKGPFFYDCAIKVPLIISWPGHIKNQRISQLVELMDIPETLLDLCGLDRYVGMQGQSLKPVLNGEQKNNLHRDVYCEYLNAMACHKSPKAFASMIRSEQWKLVVSHSGNGEGELYDLINDPTESMNLFNDQGHAEIKAAMTSRLLDRWSHMVDPVPVRKAEW